METKLSDKEIARAEALVELRNKFEDQLGSLGEIVVLNHINNYKDFPSNESKLGQEFAAWLIVKLHGDLTFYINPEKMFEMFKKSKGL